MECARIWRGGGRSFNEVTNGPGCPMAYKITETNNWRVTLASSKYAYMRNDRIEKFYENKTKFEEIYVMIVFLLQKITRFKSAIARSNRLFEEKTGYLIRSKNFRNK